MTCDFCQVRRSGTDDAFKAIYPAVRNRVIAKGDGFFVTPTIGQLHPTHMLLVSERHVTSFFPSDPRILAKARQALVKLGFTQGIFFEHGSPLNPLSNNCGVEHAHVHFIATEWVQTLSDFRAITFAEMVPTERFTVRSQHMSEYLFLASWEGELWLAQRNITSQIVRKIVGHHLGVQWDWRSYGMQLSVVALVNGDNSRNFRGQSASRVIRSVPTLSQNI